MHWGQAAVAAALRRQRRCLRLQLQHQRHQQCLGPACSNYSVRLCMACLKMFACVLFGFGIRLSGNSPCGALV